MKKYIKFISMGLLLIALSACSGQTENETQPVPETPVSTPDSSMIEDPSDTEETEVIEQEDIFFPDSGAEFSLSEEEEALYEQLKAELTSDVVENVNPVSIAKIYVQAGIDCEWEVEWALFAEDTITTDKESFGKLSEEENARYTKESRQGAANWYFPYLDEAVFEENGNDGVLIFHQATGDSEDPYDEYETEFKMKKNDKGIWEIVYNPLA